MSADDGIERRIDAAAEAVGSAWPLHSFVTANPLAGLEDRPFHEAVADAGWLFGGDGYPSADVFRRALAAGRIDRELLAAELDAHGYDVAPESSLERLAAESPTRAPDATTATDRVDAVLSKWLSAFLDQGRATWPMPNRESGFYAAVRAVLPHDGDVPDVGRLPDCPVDAVRDRLDARPADEWQTILEYQLAALPGWTGLLKRRVAADDDWASAAPITLVGYLAARLTLVDLFDAPLAPPTDRDEGDDGVPLAEIWLRAWEATYRTELVGALTDASASISATRGADGDRPDAQLVFCIDTRSEVVRRHVEAVGDYETYGYAGFFGIPMRYAGYDSPVTVDACPPIVEAEHRIAERPTGTADGREAHDRRRATLDAGRRAAKRLTTNAATAFNFVEAVGAGYGVGLAARTLLPGRVHDLLDAVGELTPDADEFCAPAIDDTPDAVTGRREGLTLEQQVSYAATAFELTGWETFARLVVFTGHASETANNPFDSSLDCGACAGSAGGPNARVLAAICNDEAVRSRLRDRGVDVPADTVFVAAEHNTTTDEVTLYADDVPETHAAEVERLRADLETARAGAAAERTGDAGVDAATAVRETERRAADWAETRPEWGLAGNAGFVVGPRALTDDLDLDGRVFLHSYDWRTDPDGDALEAVLTGPMVVARWINAGYYFATVDNAAYGSGSKVTQNPVGNVGVYQGNGGDLLTGLPSQSVASGADDPYHQPLRLSVVIHAPVGRVTDALAAQPDVADRLDNGWLSLTVVDPEQDHRAFHYDGGRSWTPADTSTPATPPLADD
jgi:uncharacterized protein YbcC (UPF0753/DUF2309 family)